MNNDGDVVIVETGPTPGNRPTANLVPDKTETTTVSDKDGDEEASGKTSEGNAKGYNGK